MPECILVTELEYGKGEAVFRSQQERRVISAPADEQGLAQAIRAQRCRAAIVGIQRYSGPLYEALEQVGGERGAIIARFGVGHENIDDGLARQHHIVVTNTPGVLDQSVAEHALWLMGAVARHVAQGDAAMRAGHFSPQVGTELRGKALAVMGFGAIGRRVAQMAHFGPGMKVLAEDVRPLEELAQREALSIDQVKAKYGLDDYTTAADQALRGADIVTIHMPASPETEGYFNAQRLATMKPGAILVNTARGSLIDENALYDALAGGHLAGAGLDVFAEEPYRPQDVTKDLRTLPNTVLTPHVASNTQEANARMAQAALANVDSFFAGRLSELSRVKGLAVKELAPARAG